MIKDIFTKRENQIMLGIIVLSIILILVGFYFLNKNNEDFLPRTIPNSIDKIVWKTFKNEKYDFDVQYPEHFLVFEEEKDMGPIFNFYFDKKGASLPFDHFTNVSQISVFPMGVATGGLNFSFEEGELTNSNGTEFSVKEYKTFSGETWGLMATPKNPPKNWKEWGFIWISSKISNSQIKCFDGDMEKDFGVCNPFEGDQMFQEGSIDSEFIKIGREFLDKIGFE